MAKTKYTEIPHEEMPDLDATLCTNADKMIRDEESETASLHLTNEITCDAPLLRVLADENSPTTTSCISCHRHRRKSSETILRQCSGGTLKNRQRKSHSLPSSYSLNSVNSDDSVVLQIPAEDFASQLTLLDLPVFASITPEELVSCSWNKRNKLEIAPNVVAFTKRFNQVSFWAVQETLKGSTCKNRADILSHYIRIGKKLLELNNFHSLFAIVSALRSTPIYRLKKSWYYVPRKDKQLFEKLTSVFSQEDNWKNLRDRVESLKLPCIPYLGMFLTDLVYVNMAHPHSGGLETEQRRFKMNNILRVISHLQQSQYGLAVLDDVQQYLNSIDYIEELQKFIEDDQYKLSLKLEPLSPTTICCNDDKSLLPNRCSSTVASLNLSPAKLPSKLQNSTCNCVSGHRKCFSLEPKMLKNFPIDNKTPPRHLLDDSVIEDGGLRYTFYRKADINKSLSTNHDELDRTVLLEGCLKKKVIFKNGCHPTVASWHRFWVQVSATSLLFYSPKCFKGISRNDFKKCPSKIWLVEGCIVTLGENPDIFFYKDTRRSKLYKFRAVNDSAALSWYRTLYNVAEGKREEINPLNLITFE